MGNRLKPSSSASAMKASTLSSDHGLISNRDVWIIVSRLVACCLLLVACCLSLLVSNDCSTRLARRLGYLAIDVLGARRLASVGGFLVLYERELGFRTTALEIKEIRSAGVALFVNCTQELADHLLH